MSRDGLTVKQITERLLGEGRPATVGDGTCPCAVCTFFQEQSVGLVESTGTAPGLVPYPNSTAHMVPYFTSAGLAGWVNLSALVNPVEPNPNGPVEAAPPPRESNGGPGEQTVM